MQCPDCGGAMWDNRSTKKPNSKQPDFKCKNKDGCGKGVWLKDSEKNALQATEATSGQTQKRAIVIDSLMEQCLIAALVIADKNLKAINHDGTSATVDNVLNMATTMFIARVNGQPGILKVEKEGVAKAQAKAAEAERLRKEREEPTRQAVESREGGWDTGNYPADDDRDDDLPF